MTSSDVIERVTSEAPDLCREFGILAQAPLMFAVGWVVCVDDAAFHARTREAIGVCVLDEDVGDWDVRVDGDRVSIHSGEAGSDPASWSSSSYDAVPIGADLAASVRTLLGKVAERIGGIDDVEIEDDTTVVIRDVDGTPIRELPWAEMAGDVRQQPLCRRDAEIADGARRGRSLTPGS